MYNTARENGDVEGMRAANDGMNQIRNDYGLAAQFANSDINYIKGVTGYGSGSSGGGSLFPDRATISQGGFFDGGATTIRDGSGRKVATVNEGMFGTTIRDASGNSIGSVREGFFGGTHVDVGGSQYEVRDSFFGDSKIVSENGKTVGRIEKDFWGNDVFKKE